MWQAFTVRCQQHLNQSGCSYLQHLFRVLAYVWQLLVICACLVIHGFAPALLEHTGSHKLDKLNESIKRNNAARMKPLHEPVVAGNTATVLESADL